MITSAQQKGGKIVSIALWDTHKALQKYRGVV